jgi:hypothetical protein
MHNKNQTYSHKKRAGRRIQNCQTQTGVSLGRKKKNAWASNLSLFDNHTTQNHQNIHTQTETPNLVTNSATQMITTKPQTGSSTPKARTSTHYFPPILLDLQEKPSLRITKCTKSNNASPENFLKRDQTETKRDQTHPCASVWRLWFVRVRERKLKQMLTYGKYWKRESALGESTDTRNTSSPSPPPPPNKHTPHKKK